MSNENVPGVNTEVPPDQVICAIQHAKIKIRATTPEGGVAYDWSKHSCSSGWASHIRGADY